ncbi:MAG: excalibur calcium-binding domain-containing protein [Pseudoxanthomonas sp.]
MTASSALEPASWLVLLLAVAVLPGASAHGGGLDKQGCHHNRKTGEYHCHRGAGSPRPAPSAEVDGNSFAPSRAAPPHRQSRPRPFRNCTEARAAGAAPVHRGDPGYGAQLDRDNDGIGCEPYRGR